MAVISVRISGHLQAFQYLRIITLPQRIFISMMKRSGTSPVPYGDKSGYEGTILVAVFRSCGTTTYQYKPHARHNGKKQGGGRAYKIGRFSASVSYYFENWAESVWLPLLQRPPPASVQRQPRFCELCTLLRDSELLSPSRISWGSLETAILDQFSTPVSRLNRP